MGKEQAIADLLPTEAGLIMPRVLIIGSGMSGMMMGIRLKQAGITSFSILEKADRVGGTWRENTYPGLSCDLPSHYYSYSFEPNPNWGYRFSPGSEIFSYFEKIPGKYDIEQHIEFNNEVLSATFDNGEWVVKIKDGEEKRADFIVAACGFLHHPRYPDIKGLQDFQGKCFHSAQWNHDIDLTGKRVGIIGTGSSGIQMVAPLSEQVGKLTIFQRTAQWVFPLPDRKYSSFEKWLAEKMPWISKLTYHGYRLFFEKVIAGGVLKPGWQRNMIFRSCRAHLKEIKDPELRRKLTPDYQPMCKRLVMTKKFYPAVQKEHVDLVIDPIDHIEADGVVMADGTKHLLDVLVLATGFNAQNFMKPIAITGENGVTLNELWEDGAKGYRTVGLPGFPNFFMIMGPHSPIANFSLISVAETQTDYILKCIQLFQKGTLKTLTPTKEATHRLNEEMKNSMSDTIWITGCQSWYLDKNGVPAIWPWSAERFRNDLYEPDLREYRVET